jgi:ABC-type glycerol-3-phosphate transport system substrate-binding protein
VNTSFGTVPALRTVDQSDANQGGPGGGLGPGNFGPGNFALSIPAELEPLIDVAIERAIPLSEGRFSDGIVTALNLMEDEGYDARTALDTVQSDLMTDLTAADARAATTQIAVQEPVLPRQLAAGEIALNFATLGGGGGGPGGGFALEQQWQATADAFADADPEVGLVTIGQENQNQLATVAETYDCFYADSNLVPDADLSLLLNLDPLLSTDPAFDPNDYISGVFDQVKVNNQTWALPLQISPLVLRIDYDIFRQAGVNPPQGSWTVSEFEDAIRNIQFALADDQTPVTLNVSGESAMLTLIAAYGGLPLDTRTDPPTVNFSDPATVNALQQVLDLVKNGYISYAAGGPGGGGFGGGGQNTASLAIYSNNLNALGFGGFGGPGGGGFGGGQNTNTDGIITFPLGTQFNAVPLELSAGYISAYTQHADACYRFLKYLSNATDLFQSMPARHSVINSQALMTAQGEQNVAFYNALADLIEQPTTIIVPDNIDAGTFGMTNWLFDVFDRYTAGEVVDLESDLRVAETTTRDYLTCVAAIPPIDFAQDGPQAFFQQIQACQDAVDPDI